MCDTEPKAGGEELDDELEFEFDVGDVNPPAPLVDGCAAGVVVVVGGGPG